MPILWAFLEGPAADAEDETRRPATLVFDHPLEELDILSHGAVRAAQFLDLAHGVHHGGVVPATEFPPDLGQRARRQLLAEIHRDLARPRDGAGAARRMHIGETDVVVLGDALLD